MFDETLSKIFNGQIIQLEMLETIILCLRGLQNTLLI